MATGNLLVAPSIIERAEVVRKHLDFSVQWKGPIAGIFEMRTHYGPYFKGVPNFKEYRTRLVMASTHQQVHEILDEVVMKYQGMPLTV
jgi:tRNA-dihydrouridine synthase